MRKNPWEEFNKELDDTMDGVVVTFIVMAVCALVCVVAFGVRRWL